MGNRAERDELPTGVAEEGRPCGSPASARSAPQWGQAVVVQELLLEAGVGESVSPTRSREMRVDPGHGGSKVAGAQQADAHAGNRQTKK